MCVPTLAFFPSHSKKSGLSSPEEPETNSIIVPSAKTSPALIMRFVAFDPPFTLGFALVFKATSSLAQRLCTKTQTRPATAKMRVSQKQKAKICIPYALLLSCVLALRFCVLNDEGSDHFVGPYTRKYALILHQENCSNMNSLRCHLLSALTSQSTDLTGAYFLHKTSVKRKCSTSKGSSTPSPWLS